MLKRFRPLNHGFWLGLVVVVAAACSDVNSAATADSAKQAADDAENSAAYPEVVHQPDETTAEVPDFAEYPDIPAMKEAYFTFLIPLVQAEKAHIETLREQLLTLAAAYEDREQLTAEEAQWLAALAERYGIDTDQPKSEQFAALQLRVDIVPKNLVLMQAANETGWGRSRFAREALNFFGQWCWTAGCGLVPRARPDGQVYEVRKFNSVESSVRSYLHNLNTHFAYEELREQRAQLRAEGEDLTIANLGPGLKSYSERGQAYVDELLQMLRINRSIIEQVSTELATTDEVDGQAADEAPDTDD